MEAEQIVKKEYEMLPLSSINDKLIEEFSCGNNELDNKLFKMKNSNDKLTTIGLVECYKNTKHLVGYCTYTASGISCTNSYDKITFSAAEIKYFAIDEKYQHMYYDKEYKFSDFLLDNIIKHFYDISDNIISFDYIILYSVPTAVSFYKRANFYEFAEFMKRDSYIYIEDCIPMYYKM